MHSCTPTARAVVTGLLAIAVLTSTAGQERRVLPGHVPAAAAKIAPIDRLPPTRSLRLAIGLPLRNQAALTNLLRDLYDPASPNYRHYLTPEQFTERFGPTEGDYQAVIAFAQANGLAVTVTHADRMLLDVAGAVGDVEAAFQVTMRVYPHPTEARTFFALDTEPSVESNLPIQDISGLNDFQLPRPNLRKPVPLERAGRTKAVTGGSGPGGSFIGADFRAAYAPGVALAGAGQAVGLLEFDGYYASDITEYVSLAGLTNVPLQKVLVDGFNGIPTTGANSGNSEVALDIEMVIAMATNLSKVVVFEAGPNGLPLDILSTMSGSTYTNVRQFATSWSWGNSTPSGTMDAYFQKFITQGQSFFSASGDSGAYSGTIPQPWDDPYVTLVGGTTLATCSPGGAWLSETAWNTGDGADSTSGGISTTYAISTCIWQQGISMTANHGSTTHRNLPDVAMVADNILIVADNGQQELTGGTSAAVQLWAAFVALANQQAAASAQPSVGFINPAIYAIGKSAAFSANFDDITAGNNTNTTTTQFLAVPSYDLCTGWGSPSGGSLIIALARPDGLQISPGRGLTANGPAGGPFNVSAQSLSLTNSGASALTWSLSNTSLWLTVTSAGGTLTPGGAAATVALTLNSAANRLANGVYTANLLFSNVTSHLSQIRQVTVQVGQEMVQDGGFEVGEFAYWNLFGPNLFWTDQYGDLIPFSFVDDGSTYGLTPYAGTYSANLGATNLDYLAQVLPTRVGQPYLLSFWWESVDVGGGTMPSEFLVKWNTSTLANALNVGAFDWTEQQFVVQATVTNTVLEFGFRDVPGVLGLDAVSVIPIPLPSFQAVAKANGKIQFSWTAMAGVSYQLQYKTNLTSTNWINLGGPTNAVGSTVSASDSIGPSVRRFYRVALLP